MSSLRITYRKSAIGYAHDQKATIAALGLRHLQQTVEHPDTPALRGMVRKVAHLVSIEGHPADGPAGVALLASPVGAGAGPGTAPAAVAEPAASGRRRRAAAQTGERP